MSKAVRRGFIYGSWAARYSGEPGAPPRDVDVLVVGKTSPQDLDDVAWSVEPRLRRPVNFRRVSEVEWENPAGQDEFLRTVRSRALAEVPLHDAAADDAGAQS